MMTQSMKRQKKKLNQTQFVEVLKGFQEFEKIITKVCQKN